MECSRIRAGQARFAKVDGFHQLKRFICTVLAGTFSGFDEPVVHFVQTELVCFCAVPGKVETAWALIFRANTILPAVTGNEIATRVADRGDAQFAHEFEHICAEAFFIGVRG